jgi:AraC family transcriptional regulator, chitin signaling transcriptional activator
MDLQSLEVTTLPLQLNGETLSSFLPGFSPHDFIAITKEGSVFKVDSSLSKTSLLTRLITTPSNNLALCAIKASNNRYYVGMLSTQMMSFCPAGNKVIVDTNFPALQDNTVLNLYEGNEGSIWALLNDGLDCIEVSSPMSTLFENASVYDVLINDNNLFIATNLGVSKSSGKLSNSNDLNIQNVIGLEGQAWSLHEFEGPGIMQS